MTRVGAAVLCWRGRHIHDACGLQLYCVRKVVGTLIMCVGAAVLCWSGRHIHDACGLQLCCIGEAGRSMMPFQDRTV
jgi:hypothetical protein